MARQQDEFHNEFSDSESTDSIWMEDSGYMASTDSNISLIEYCWGNWSSRTDTNQIEASVNRIFNEVHVSREIITEEFDSALNDDAQTSTSNWMEDPSYVASGGEDLESYLVPDNSSVRSQFYRRDTGVTDYLSFVSYMGSLKLKFIKKKSDIGVSKNTIVCQESGDEDDVHNHLLEEEYPGTGEEDRAINLVHRSQFSHYDQYQPNNFLMFSYLMPEVDGFGNLSNTIQPAIIVPSGAYYSSNNHTPMVFPTLYRSRGSEITVQNQFNADDVEVSEYVDQSNESHSDAQTESTLFVEITRE